MKLGKPTIIVIAATLLIVGSGALLSLIPSKPDVTVTFAGHEVVFDSTFSITNRSNGDVSCCWEEREGTKLGEKGFDGAITTRSHDNPHCVFVPNGKSLMVILRCPFPTGEWATNTVLKLTCTAVNTHLQPLISSKPDVTVTFAGHEVIFDRTFSITNRSNRDVRCDWEDLEWIKVDEKDVDGAITTRDQDDPYCVFVPKGKSLTVILRRPSSFEWETNTVQKFTCAAQRTHLQARIEQGLRRVTGVLTLGAFAKESVVTAVNIPPPPSVEDVIRNLKAQ